MNEKGRKEKNPTLTVYLVIVRRNLPWLAAFLAISAGTVSCCVLEWFGVMESATLARIAAAAFVPWAVSLVAFLADATSRDNRGRRLKVKDE